MSYLSYHEDENKKQIESIKDMVKSLLSSVPEDMNKPITINLTINFVQGGGAKIVYGNDHEK